MNGVAYALPTGLGHRRPHRPAPFFSACRGSSRISSTSPGCRRAPHRRVAAAPGRNDSAFAQRCLATGMTSLGKTQMSETASALRLNPRLGPCATREHRPPAGASSSAPPRSWPSVRCRLPMPMTAANRPEFPRPAMARRVKPSRGRLPLDKEVRQMPIRIVANGVVSRSVRDTAAFYREAERIWWGPKLAPIGDVQQAGAKRLRIAVITHSLLRESSPEVRELTLKSAALLEELGHRVVHLEKPPVPSSFVSVFVLYWGLLATGGIQHNSAPSTDPMSPVGKPVAGPGACPPKSAPHAAGADPFLPRAPAHRTAGSHLRPRADADAG